MARVVIVTGTSSGVGKATARLFRQQGDTVFGLARHATAQTELAQSGVKLIDVDLAQPEQVDRAMIQILSRTKRIDVLANIAGMAVNGAVEDIPLADAQQEFNVNLFGVIDLTRHVLPIMRAQHSGRIINITSLVTQAILPFMGWYVGSKSALEKVTNSLRSELDGTGVSVTNIQPSGIATPMSQDPAAFNKYSAKGPYAKMMRAFDKMMVANQRTAIAPEKVGALVVKTADSANPKAVLRIGAGATAFMVMNRLLSVNTYSKLIMRMIKRNMK